MTKQDYAYYDLLIGMDHANLRNMRRICGGDPDGKLHLLLDYTEPPRRGCRPMVHRRLSIHMGGRDGGVPRAIESA